MRRRYRLAFGDSAACIGGKLFGGRKLPWNEKKTWAGMLSFIVAAAPMATIAYFSEANVLSLAFWGDGRPISVSLAQAALCGTVATISAQGGGIVAEQDHRQPASRCRGSGLRSRRALYCAGGFLA